MKRTLSALCLLAASAGLFAADEKSEDITTRVTSLTIRKPLPPKKVERFSYVDPGGTTLNVAFTAPGKYILGIDVKASKLDRFSDDKETKLFPGNRFGMSWLFDSPMVSPDGEQCTVQIGGNVPPARGASKIELKATVVLKCGADARATEKKELTIKKDRKETVGDFTLQVNNDGSTFGNPQILILSPTQNLKSVQLFDDKGEELKMLLPPYRQNVYGTGGKLQYGLYCTLPKKMSTVSVKVHYFEKTDSVSAPVDLSFGVGLE